MSSNSVCGSKQPFWALSALANCGSPGSGQALALSASSSSPSKTKPSGAGSPSPRMISRYLSPNEDLYRTLNTESLGRGWAVLSSFRFRRATTPPVWPTASFPPLAWAVAVASSDWIASIDSTTPTRCPPILISLLGVRREASGISIETR